jgi:hypothetical protein
MVPAQQRLDPDDPLVSDVDDRLIAIVSSSRAMARRNSTSSSERSLTLASIARETPIARPAELLGAVKGDVGTTQQFARVLAVRGAPADPTTARNLDRMPHDQKRLAHQGHDILSKGVGLGLPAGAAHQDEFVTPEPGDEVTCRQHMAQPHGDLPDKFVPDMVPERIVDPLEPVEIEIGDKDVPRTSPRDGGPVPRAGAACNTCGWAAPTSVVQGGAPVLR